MKNLADTLRLVANDTSICGVAIAHDDLFVNISNLRMNGFPSADTIFAQFNPLSLSEPYFTMFPNETFKLQHHEELFPAERYNETLYTWPWWSLTMSNVIRAVAGGLGRERYTNKDGGMDFYHDGQSDFLYVPTSMAERFASHADWMVEHKIMLEVAVPAIIARLIHNNNDTFNSNSVQPLMQEAVLCTKFGFDKPNVDNWLPTCIANETAYGTFHPVKLGMIGNDRWDAYFDTIVLGK